MNNLDKTYTKLLQDILDNGVKKKDRTGTGTLSVFGRQIRHDMKEGFPLLTTKKMHWKSIVTELLWFLRGDTNIQYLVQNGCHIWDGDAYKAYTNHFTGYDDVPSIEWFINEIKTNDEFAKQWGELGPIYGKQWRNWKTTNVRCRGIDEYYMMSDDSVIVEEGAIDQIANAINRLKTDPDSRRNKVSAWNVGEIEKMTLPPCHTDFQFYTRELSLKERSFIANSNHYEVSLNIRGIGVDEDHTLHKHLDEINIPTRAISLMWNQRSVDTFLGLPFNIASYGLLLEIIAKEVNMVPDELIGTLGDTHLYLNHIEQAKEQIGRELTLEERTRYKKERDSIARTFASYTHQMLDNSNVPTRTREPFPLPKLIIDKFDENNHYIGDMDDISEYNIDQFKLEGYQSHPAIKAPLSN
jgi:thymidylate synthase